MSPRNLAPVAAAAVPALRRLHAAAVSDRDAAGPRVSSDASQSAPTVKLSTRDAVANYDIVEELGVVSSSDVRSVNILKDIAVAILGVAGGPTPFYGKLLADATEGAVEKLGQHARALGADGVVGLRVEKALVMNRLIVGLHASVVCYGTAVKLRPSATMAASQAASAAQAPRFLHAERLMQ